MDRAECAFLQRIIAEVRPATSLEIGMAYGVSTLSICEALAALGRPARHIVADPFQRTQWRGIGLRNVEEAGFASLIDFHEERSEYLLPHLAASGLVLDFALVDGWHTFDQVMVEFYYIDRMLRAGSVVAFDDADRRSVSHVIRYALKIPGYEVFAQPGKTSRRVSLAGRLRRLLNHVPRAASVFRPDFLARDWDLGIGDSCVALRKTATHQRSSGWYREF